MKRSGWLRRTTPLKAKGWLKRLTPLAKVNRKRKASEWERCYGSVSRVIAIKAMGCAVPGCNAPVGENAHLGNEGTGRKSHWSRVVPLCGVWYNGHHTALDIGCAGDVERFDRKYGTDLNGLAERLAVELGP